MPIVPTITATVVPRRLSEDRKHLEFFLVFSFAVPDDAGFPSENFLTGAAGDHPKAKWPRTILEKIEGMKAALNWNGPAPASDKLTVIAYPEEKEIVRQFPSDAHEYGRGLEIRKDDQQHSDAAWVAMFASCVRNVGMMTPEESSAIRTPPRSPLRRFFDDAVTTRLDNDVAKLQANPRANSDLRPSHRLDSPDQPLATAFRQEWRAAAVHGRTVRAMNAQQRHLWRLRIAAAADDVRRADRMIKAGRNVAGGGNLVTSTHATPPATDVLLKPTWQELLGRAAQFPGLQRRLKLALYCKIALSGEVQGLVKGTLSVSLSADATFLGFNVVEAATAVIAGPPRLFRADPEGTELASEGGEEPVWQEHSLLPARLFEVAQEDGFTAAARGLAAAANDQEMSPAASVALREGLAIRSVPPGGASVAEDLAGHLIRSGTKNQMMLKVADLRRQRTALRLRDAEASQLEAEIATIRQNSADVLNARDLVRGVSPQVQRNGNDWNSLCVREVVLRDKSGRSVLRWVEEGFVTLSVTATRAPAAGTVLQVPKEPDSILKVLVAGMGNTAVVTDDAVSARDFSIVLPRNPPTGASSRPTQFSSLIRPMTTADELCAQPPLDPSTHKPAFPGDVVHVSAPLPASGNTPPAAEVVIFPVFTLSNAPAAPSPLTPVTARNDARQEDFPVLLHDKVTRYLDVNGRQLLDASGNVVAFPTDGPLWKEGFLVEGDRRSVVRDGNTVKAIEPATDVDLANVETVFSPAAPDSILHRRHVIAAVDEPALVSIPRVSRDNQNQPVVETKRWLRLNGAARLETVRGRAAALRIEFAGKVEFVNAISSGAHAGRHEVKFYHGNLGGTLLVFATAPAKDHTLRGVARLDPATSGSSSPCYVVDSQADITPLDRDATPPAPVTNEADVKSTDEVRALAARPSFQWRMSLQTLSGRAQEIVFAENIAGTTLSAAEKGRFITSESLRVPYGSSPGTLLECVGVQTGVVLKARFLPQYIFGTIGWDADASGVLTCPNGETLPGLSAKPLAASDPQAPGKFLSGRTTGFFEFTPAGPGVLLLEARFANGGTGPTLWTAVGEVIHAELPNALPPQQPSPQIRVTFAQDIHGRNSTLLAAPEARYYPADPALPLARVRDLVAGDYLFVEGHLDAKGQLDFTGAAGPLPLGVGMVGRVGRAEDDDAAAVATGEGQIDLTRQRLTTDGGVERTVWTPPLGVVSPTLYALGPTALIFARTVTFYQPTSKPSDVSIASAGATDVTPVHAVVSDRLALWKGWSLLVTSPEDGAPDALDARDNAARNAPFTLETALPDRTRLPRLRYQSEYCFRLRRADLAGNHHFDEPLDAGTEVPGTASPGREYLRPDVNPTAPLVVRKLGGAMGIHEDPLAVPLTPRPQLVLLSDPFLPRKSDAGVDDQVVDRPADPVAFLPPPCAISTIVESQLLDGRTDLKDLFARFEKHFDDGTFRCDSAGLNYFPDPMVYDEAEGERPRVKGVDLTMEDAAGAIFAPLNAAGEQAALTPRRAFLPGRYLRWPAARPYYLFLFAGQTPRVETRNYHAEFYLPPGWTGAIRALNIATGATLTDVKLIHATTAPRLRPQWTNVKSLLDRGPKETAVRFEGRLKLNPRSTGAVRVAAHWNEYWDETPPLHFVEATVRLRVSGGVLPVDGVVIDAPGGDGYGTQARIVFESDEAAQMEGATMPVLEPMLNGGRLERLIVRKPGARLPFSLRVRVLRRPPLRAFAQGRVAALTGKRGIAAVEITDGGGYYEQPPLVVFHDLVTYDPKAKLGGEGRDAKATAVLDENGSVVRVNIPADTQGTGYSDDVAVGFYTHARELEEYPMALPGTPSKEEYRYEQNGAVYEEEATINFHQDFGDTRARAVLYTGEGSSRFRDILEKAAVRPRVSVPSRVAVQATERPPRPEWHHHAYSYRWTPGRLDRELVAFAPGANELDIRREGAIRCYLRRGWHATGEELLGVIVTHVEQNGLEFPTSDALPTLTRDERLVVSRWGYDPVWDDVPMPPLSLDDLTNQVDFIPYETLGLGSVDEKRYAGVALHRVQYDPDKELWYADLGLRLPTLSLPFLQLALARYEVNALDGLALSEVILPDPIRVPGNRRLKITRDAGAPRKLTVRLAGPFGPSRPNTGRQLPVREVLVEVRRRQPDLAPEIEGPLVFDAAHGTPDDFDNGEPNGARVKLRQLPQGFEGEVNLPAGSPHVYLRVVEREVYPSDEAQRDRTGDAGELRTANSPDASRMETTADWRPFTCGVAIE